jgi:hypothetical protein
MLPERTRQLSSRAARATAKRESKGVPRDHEDDSVTRTLLTLSPEGFELIWQ